MVTSLIRMGIYKVFFIFVKVLICTALNGQENYTEMKIFHFIGEMVLSNYKDNGWPVLLFYGSIPDEFYNQIRSLHLSHVHLDSGYEPMTIANTVPYRTNTIVMSCTNYTNFGNALSQITTLEYWYPHAHIFVYVAMVEDEEEIAKIFYNFWWYQSLNVFIVKQDCHNNIHIYNYSPYVYEGYSLETNVNCVSSKRWTVNFNVRNIADYVTCELGCNFKAIEKTSRKFLPACISFNKRSIDLNITSKLQILFEDQTVDLRGFPLTVYGQTVPPFLVIDQHQDGSYHMTKRDGQVWNTLSKHMNFTMKVEYDADFGYMKTTKKIFDLSYRVIDIVALPIYQQDLMVTVLDLLFPIRASGVCIISHRAGYEAMWFDTEDINYVSLVMVVACAVCIWITISVFKYSENKTLSFDQLGKNLSNTIRNILNVCIHQPPRVTSFRIYEGISLWCFFLLNFTIQASIVSFLTVVKRGKEVETFQDIAERGYPLKGFISPDMVLPEENDVFIKINSMQVKTEDMFGCMNALENSTHLFCLMDCTLANYFEKNKLDSGGEPFLHVAKDQIHRLFLNMIMPWRSPFTQTMNKYLMIIFEEGFIKKWESYRYDKIHNDGLNVEPISVDDLYGIFQIYIWAITFIIGIFMIEILPAFLCFLVRYFKGLHLMHIKKMNTKTLKNSNVEASTQTLSLV